MKQQNRKHPDNQTEQKSYPAFAILLWLLFLVCTLLIAYLSFQNGADAKALGRDFIRALALRYYQTDTLSEDLFDEFTYLFRQGGRIAIFFLLGIFGTGAVHLTFRRRSWFFRMLLSVLMLLFIAVFTERFKLYLPTRHYSAQEMLFSISGAMLGFVFVSVATLVFTLLSGLFKLFTNRTRP